MLNKMYIMNIVMYTMKIIDVKIIIPMIMISEID